MSKTFSSETPRPEKKRSETHEPETHEPETLRLFVSATNDLEAERAIVGRILAELPVKIGVEIRRTPVAGAKYDDLYEMIANCDRVYFLIGQDISAPSGAEWQLAWQLERDILPLRSNRPLTPAANEFMRSTAPLNWKEFGSSGELAHILSLDLVHLLDHPKNRYGLNVTERELLRAHGNRLRQRAAKIATATVDDPGGIEGGGVLLDDLRKDPIDAILLDK